MKKTQSVVKTLIIFILCIITILGLIYLGLGYYYRSSFSFGTWINGVYCTGLDVDEVNDKLSEGYRYDGLEVKSENGNSLFYINAEDIEFSYDFKEALHIYLSANNEWLWISNLFVGKNRTLTPVVHINKNKLYDLLEAEPSIHNEKPAYVETLIDDNGNFILIDNMMHRPITDKIEYSIENAILQSKTELIVGSEFYLDEEYTTEQLAVIDEFANISTNMSPDITYSFGDDIEHITKETLLSFLKRDENGELVKNDSYENGSGISEIDNLDENSDVIKQVYEWDDDLIDAWVDALCDKYDTLGATRTFTTTLGDTIQIGGGIYGNKIDRNAEKKYLKEALRGNACEYHEPIYTQKAIKQGLDDIGDTYIEVNLTAQMLYYYEKGELIIETPVVSGNMLLGRDTPDGVNYVYYKQRNRTLHGTGYSSFVKYWIAVKGAIGIHDASWRDEYGGDIYLTDGSHGCINTPEDQVSKLYDLVEIGTPAVMFYTE